jgi:hypothetical protein
MEARAHGFGANAQRQALNFRRISRWKSTSSTVREVSRIREVLGCAGDDSMSGCIGGDWYVCCREPEMRRVL